MPPTGAVSSEAVGESEHPSSGDAWVNGIRLHYYRTGGAGPTLILLHGITDSGRCWPRPVRHLRDQYDLVMVDARGHGLSEAPDRGYSFQDHAADLMGLIQVLGLRRPVLVGHSMGAVTALVAAAQAPGEIGALVLEDPPLADPEGASLEPETWREEARARILKERGQPLAELIAERRAESPNWSDDELAPWAEAKHQVSPQVAEIAFSLPVVWRPLMRRIDCPILLLTADPKAGACVTPEIAREAASWWRDGRTVSIQGAGHNIRRDQFANYMAALTAFLADVGARQGQPQAPGGAEG